MTYLFGQANRSRQQKESSLFVHECSFVEMRVKRSNRSQNVGFQELLTESIHDAYKRVDWFMPFLTLSKGVAGLLGWQGISIYILSCGIQWSSTCTLAKHHICCKALLVPMHVFGIATDGQLSKTRLSPGLASLRDGVVNSVSDSMVVTWGV